MKEPQQKITEEEKLGCFSPGRTPSHGNWNAEDLWGLIQTELKPHRL